jgi:hypothetical protein
MNLWIYWSDMYVEPPEQAAQSNRSPLPDYIVPIVGGLHSLYPLPMKLVVPCEPCRQHVALVALAIVESSG